MVRYIGDLERKCHDLKIELFKEIVVLLAEDKLFLSRNNMFMITVFQVFFLYLHFP